MTGRKERAGSKTRGVVLANRLLCGASLAVIALALPSVARAQDADRNWDANGTTPGNGGTGTWDTTALRWSPNTDGTSGPYATPWDNTLLDNAIFGGTAGTVTLGVPITVHNITFNTSGYTLTGNTLTLDGTTPTITVNSGTSTISSIVAGTAGITKAGAGALTLSGNNSFTGNVTVNLGTLTLNGTNSFAGVVNVNAGTLSVNSNAALGNASNVINLSNGAVLTTGTTGTSLAGRTVNLTGGQANVNGAGAGSAHFTGTGGLTVAAVGSTGQITLSDNTNDFTGSMSFVVNNAVAASFTSIGNIGQASALGAGDTISLQANSGVSALNYTGGAATSNRNWQITTGIGSPTALIQNVGSGALTLTGTISSSGTAAVALAAGSADLLATGVISSSLANTFRFIASGSGSITLGNANTFTGPASIESGIVRVGTLANSGVTSSLGAGTAISLTSGTLSYTGAGASSNRSLTATSGTIRNDGTGALTLSGATSLTTSLTLGGSFTGADNVISGVISGTGSLISSGNAAWELTGANTRSGAITVDGGSLRAGSASAFGTTTGITTTGGTLDLNGFNMSTTSLTGTGGTVALGGANLTLTLGTGVSNSYGGSITGGGNLTKLGAGTLTLTGVNSYVGATTIGGGTLALDFSPAGGPTSNILASTSSLSMGGGTFAVTGAAGETNSQTVNGLTITGGNNIISANSGSATSLTLNLGAITRLNGLANFVLPAAGAITTANADGALGGWATVNGADYAKVQGGNIVAFTDADYTDQDDASLWTSGQFISDSDGDGDSFFGTVGSSIQLGGLQFTAPDATTTVTIAAGQTLGVDGSIIIAPSVLTNNQTITGGAITGTSGGGVLGVQQNGAGTFTIASQIVDNTGTIGFTKAGTGRAVLSGSNTYTGATTVSQGTLSVNSIANGGAASAIGASTNASSNLVMQGATLEYTGGTATSDRGFTFTRSGAITSDTISVTNATANLTLSGEVVSPDAANLVKDGAGTLTLAGSNNSYTGITTVNAGTLAVTTLANGGLNSSIGSSSSASTNVVLQNGGELEYAGATAATNRGFTLGTGGGAIDVAQASATLTMSGVAAGAGTLSKNGAGTLVLSGGNSGFATGGFVNSGTLRAGSTTAFGSGGWTVAGGATLDLGGFSNTVGGVAGSGAVNLGGATLTINSGGFGFGGSITGTGGVTKTTGLIQTFTGCGNSYTGPTTITGGIISVDCLANGGSASGIGASDSASSRLVIGSNGRLAYTGGSITIDRGLTVFGGDGYINVIGGTTLGFTGAAIGAGRLRKGGDGVLVLSGANTFTGGTVVEAGTLRAGATNAFGSGFSTVFGTGTLDLNGFDNSITSLSGGGGTTGSVLLGSATLTITNGSSSIYGGTIGGTGGLIKTGAGTQALSGCNNSYTGITTLSQGTLVVDCLANGGVNSSIGRSGSGAGNLVVNGGTLSYTGAGGSTDRQFTLGGSATINASGTGAIAFTSAVPVMLAGAGARTLTLGGTNTADNVLAAQLDDQSGGGVTSLTKTDAGTWRLSNTGSTYTGVTTISGGVLSVDKLVNGNVASSIGRSSSAATNLVIGTNSTLRYTGAGDSTNRLFTLSTGVSFIESSGTGAIEFANTGTMGFQGSGARILALGGTNTGANIMGVSITDGTGGATTVAKNDAGNWYLTGNSTYSGPTNINAGALFIGNGGTTGSITSSIVNVTGTGALGFNRSDTVTYAGTIQGAGGVTQAGTGTTVLTGTNTYTGGTTISAGTLQLGSGAGGGATGSIVGNVTNNGTFAFNRNGSHTFAGTITGTGTIAQIGSGTTTLAAANTAGATTISAGALNVNGALTTQTVAMTGTSALNVNAAMGAAAGAAATFTGDAGASTINVASGITLRAAGDLGGGSDVVNLVGTLNTGAGTLSLGDGNDTFVLDDPAVLTGGVNGGTGTDALQVNNMAARTLMGTNVGGFETLSKTLGGTLTLTGEHSYINGVTVAAGTLQIGDGTATGTLAGNVANAGTLTFNRAGTSTYAGVISGAGVVNHNGTGTTFLTGSNNYSGGTNVNAGTLLINGNQSGATGLTIVYNAATLGGTGTVGGSVLVENGGTLSPGNSPGVLTINGDLLLNNAAILNFEFGQTNVPGGPFNDLVNVGGNLTLDGVVNVTQTPGGSFGPGVYRMFNYSGTLTDNGATVGTLPSGTGFVQTAIANQVNLVNTAGLTLNFWDGAVGSKNDGLIQGGSGTWVLGGGQNNWTDANGLVNADYAQNSFAIFQGAGGTVTVDASGGAVQTAGMQFTADGYTISGAPLQLTGTQASIRVGDGSAGDAGLTATIGAALTGATQLVKTDGGTLVLTGTNSYTGGTAINGGTLQISSNANLGDAAGGLSFNGGTLHTTAGLTMARNIDLAGAGTIDTDLNFDLVYFDGVVSGGGALIKQGIGTLVLRADNSYTGGTTIDAGTLAVGNGGTAGWLVGDIVNNASLLFVRSDNVIFDGTISGSGTVFQGGAGVLTLTANNSYTGNTRIGGAFASTLQLGNGGTTGSVVGDIENHGTLIFNRSNEYSFAGTISGAGVVRQEGTGTTIFTAANSYTGSTVISSGTLLINGNQTAANGTTNVLGGGTLGGTGTIGGDVFVGGGATLTPGDATGPGTLTINGNLGFSPNAVLAYEFGHSNVVGGPLNDLTEVAGDLTLDGTIDVTVAPGGSFGPGLYRVISYGGALTNNGLNVGTMPAGSTVAVQTSVDGQVNLVNAAGGTFNFWDGAAPANDSNNLVDGGDGIWQNSSGNNDWTTTDGAVSGPYSDDAFAIFAAAPGTVEIDNSLGAVTASGLQFASDGYTITGQNLTLVDPESVIRVGDGTAAGLGMTATIDTRIFGATQLVKADLGTLVLTRSNTYTGGTRIDAGTLRISSDVQLGDAAGALSLNGGTLNTTVAMASGRVVNLLGTGTLSTDAGTSLTLFGSVSGAGGFTKAGTGILMLTGNNSFGGDVEVTAGQMFVNGDQSAATGATSVASGAALSGSGIIGGNVAIADGAALDPGSTLFGVGTLTINGDLALSSSSAIDFQLGQANVAGGALNDLVNVGGDLTLDGTINVLVPAGGSFGPGIYRVFNYGGTLTDNGLTLGTLPGGSAVSVQTAIAGQVNLVNTAGLTLSFWDGGTGPKNNGAVNGGDGIWRVGGGSSNWTDVAGALNADYTQNGFAIFSAAPGTVTIDDVGGAVQASGLQFASDGYTITGDTLALTGTSAIVQVGDGSAASAGMTATIDAALTGSAQLVKTDAGTLVLTAANSYTGGTAINGGTLQVSSNANLGDAAGGLSFDGGTLNTTADMTMIRNVDLVGAGTFDTDGGTQLTVNGVVSGGGALVKVMGGTLVLTGTNSYTGGTAINGGTLDVSSDANLGDASGGLSFDGGTLDITTTFGSNRAVNLVGTGTFRTQGTGFNLHGAVSGAGALVKEGNGAVTLTADNSYTGGTTIAAGTLLLGEGGTTGSILGNIVNNSRFVINRSNMYTLTGTISGSGELLQGGTGTTILTAANSYTGTTRVSAGTLLINGDQSAATGITSVAPAATLGGTGTIGGDVRVGGGTLTPGAGGAGTLTINGDLSMVAGSRLAYDFGAANAVGNPLNDLVNVGGNLTLDGTLDVAVTPGGAFDIGLYRIANYAGTLTNNGLAIGTKPAGAELFVQTSVLGQVNLVNTGSAVLNFWDGNTGPKFNGAVNGGSGVWWATGTDNWTDMTGAVNASYDSGAFAVFAGTSGLVTIDNSQGAVTASGLQIAATGGYVIQGGALTLTGPQSVIRVGDGTTAGIGYSATITSGIIGNTQLVKTDLGRLVLAGVNSYTGGTAVNGGTLRISSDANLGAASGGLSFNGGTLNTTANLASARTVDLAGQGIFSTDAGTTLTLTGNLTGTGLIGKLGAGTLVLAGTGSNTGGMGIVQGTLLVNGDYAAATGLVTMNQLTTLGGTGTLGGTVNLSGTLAPGAGGAGTLTIDGDLVISQSATLAYEFGQANVAGGTLNDLVNIGGNLTLDGTIDVTVPSGGAFDVGVYRVFNYGGTLTDNGLTLGTMPGGSSVAVQTSIAGQVNLVNSAGLALAFWDGAAGPRNNGVINGGSGIWQSGTGNDNWANAGGTVNGPYSDGAFAVFGGTGGTVTVDNGPGQVTAGGMQFAANGYTIAGGGIALTGPQSAIRVGDGSTAGAGYTATVNSVLSGNTQLVKTDAGTLVLGGANSYTGGTRINGGTVQISADANLGAAAGAVTLDGGSLATSANVTSARGLVMAGAGTISAASGTTFTLSGLLSGTGALTNRGAGTLLLTGDSSGFAGSTRVEGTMVVNGSLCGDINVTSGGRLGGTGTVCTTVNAGTVAPGNSIGTLTVAGTYTGSGGTLEIEAELGGDASPTDRLVVTQGTAGSTKVTVINVGGQGAQTVEGIKIVDVTGGTSAGTFTLNGDYDFRGSPAVIAGAFGYRLYQGGVATPTDGDWYLRSALLNPSQPNQPQVPLYQPGVPVYEAYGQTLLTLTDLGTMQQRIGNRQWAEAESGRPSGIWGRMQSSRSRPNAALSTSLSDVNVDSWKLELGADHVLSERGDGANLVLGVLGGYGEASASIGSIYGSGSIKTKAYSAGATLTWFGPQGFYIDGRAQVTWFDSKLKSTVLGELADGNNGTGQAYSVEVGKRALVGGGLSVTPQIQMTYQTVGFDRFTDPNDAVVSSRLGDSLKTRWGIALDRGDARSRLYGVVNLSYEWLDGTITDVSGTPIARENHRLWGEIGLGGSVLLGDRVTLYTEVSANTAINDFANSYSLKGAAGLRLAF